MSVHTLLRLKHKHKKYNFINNHGHKPVENNTHMIDDVRLGKMINDNVDDNDCVKTKYKRG